MNIQRLPDRLVTDYLVVGAGVAGLRAAIELAPHGRVLVLAKDALRESSSEYAQGGVAVALSDDDAISIHEQDTLNAGDGLCNQRAVHALVEEGPIVIQQLIEWGAEFDREGTRLLFAREGAHSRSRVLHAHGDSTGREISRTLYQKAVTLGNISFLSFASIVDLVRVGGRVAGAIALDGSAGRLVDIRARAVLLATGGLGRVYRDTTNPDVATGDGVAMAFRAGAVIQDVEFVQFHPTALCLPGAPRFLLSEALRGEGAHLLNAAGERFMERYHPLKELAPRDVVSRSIVAEMARENTTHVRLDLTHRGPGFVAGRFPRIYETCKTHGLDLDRQPAPVVPAAHYAMGGVATGLDGRTNLPGLFAAGEAACTGVHGANRLASNSLLEGLVFGMRAGRAMSTETVSPAGPPEAPDIEVPHVSEAEVRLLSWTHLGIRRSEDGLAEARRWLDAIAWSAPARPARAQCELRSLVTVARLISRAALARRESRGGHYRIDYPEKSLSFEKHSTLVHNREEVEFI